MKLKLKLKRLMVIGAAAGIVALSFAAGLLAGQGIPPAGAAAEYPPELAVLWEAWHIIKNGFVDRAVVQDPAPLAYAAIKAMTDALGDTGHTRFLTPDEANSHDNFIQGKFYGIGVYIGLDDENRPIVVSPFDGSPAQKAGLKAGDYILKVNGADVTGATTAQIIDLVKGDIGTPVRITVLHRGSTTPHTATIVRAEISVPVISWRFIPNSTIAFMRLNQFSAAAGDELAVALAEARNRGATGLIIDLRDNSGGLLEQAVVIASQFLNSGNVLWEEDAAGIRAPFPARDGGLALDIPVAVLVNGGTASSAEILAGAIQDHERGPVIGRTTFGAGTVLTQYTLSDGSVLLLGTSHWLTPDGRSIRRRGILPDIAVELSPGGFPLFPGDMDVLTEEELFHTGDAQLLEAIKQLNHCWDRRGCE